MYRTFVILFMVFAFGEVYAGDFNFEKTAEGIVNGLTNPKTEHTIKTRNLREISDAKTRSIKVVAKEHGKIVEKTIRVSEKSPTQGVNLKIGFDFDSYTIRPESFTILDELGKALTSESLKEKDIVIKGHTDSDGIEAYNLELSLKRALAVKSHISAKFLISPSRLKPVGYGEAVPLVSNTSKANKQINRRVEIGLATMP